MLIDLTRCTYARVPLRRGSFNKGTTQLGGGRATPDEAREKKSADRPGRRRRSGGEREREGRGRAVEHEDPGRRPAIWGLCKTAFRMVVSTQSLSKAVI